MNFHQSLPSYISLLCLFFTQFYLFQTISLKIKPTITFPAWWLFLEDVQVSVKNYYVQVSVKIFREHNLCVVIVLDDVQVSVKINYCWNHLVTFSVVFGLILYFFYDFEFSLAEADLGFSRGVWTNFQNTTFETIVYLIFDSYYFASFSLFFTLFCLCFLFS